MSLFFYSTKTRDEGNRMQDLIKQSVPDEKLRVIRTLPGLASCLRNFSSPDIALFLAADEEEVMSIVSLQKFLRKTQIIMVLPERNEELIKTVASLSPFLTCFRDTDHLDIVSFLARLKREKRIQTIEIDPKRFWWTGSIPYIPSLYYGQDMESYQIGEAGFLS
jgi:hypothetical protein